MKGELVGYTPLLKKDFNTSDKDVLPYSWHKRNYTDMLYTANPESSSFGNNNGSSIQLNKLIRKPANVFLFRFGDDIPGTEANIFNDASRLGDIDHLDTRLGTELKKEAFVCWGLPNTGHGPNFWLETITPRQVIDAFGSTAPADPSTFVGGRFIAIIDIFGGYYEFPGYIEQFGIDLASLTPYIKLFDSFNVLVIINSTDPAGAAFNITGDGDPEALAEQTAAYTELFTNGYAVAQSQCTSLSSLGFETIEPDYTTILKRIREILAP